MGPKGRGIALFCELDSGWASRGKENLSPLGSAGVTSSTVPDWACSEGERSNGEAASDELETFIGDGESDRGFVRRNATWLGFLGRVDLWVSGLDGQEG